MITKKSRLLIDLSSDFFSEYIYQRPLIVLISLLLLLSSCRTLTLVITFCQFVIVKQVLKARGSLSLAFNTLDMKHRSFLYFQKTPAYDNVFLMKYLDQVLNETLRMHSPALGYHHSFFFLFQHLHCFVYVFLYIMYGSSIMPAQPVCMHTTTDKNS